VAAAVRDGVLQRQPQGQRRIGEGFKAAAQVCADQVTNPTLDVRKMDGLFPLAEDFR